MKSSLTPILTWLIEGLAYFPSLLQSLYFGIREYCNLKPKFNFPVFQMKNCENTGSRFLKHAFL